MQKKIIPDLSIDISMKNILKLINLILSIVLLTMGGLVACVSTSQEDFESAEASIDTENETVLVEDFSKIENELAVALGYLFEFNDDEGSVDYFKMEDLDEAIKAGVLESYFNYAYTKKLDSSVCHFDYTNENIYGDLSELTSLVNFYFGSKTDVNDLVNDADIIIEDEGFCKASHEFDYNLGVQFLTSEKTSDGYSLIITNMQGVAGEKSNYCATWDVCLKNSEATSFGYELISVKRINPEQVLNDSPICIKDHFGEMSYSITLLMGGDKKTEPIKCEDLSKEQISHVLHSLISSGRFSEDYVATDEEVKGAIEDYFGQRVSVPTDAGESNLFTYTDGKYIFIEADGVIYGNLYPVFVKRIDEMIHVYVNRFYDFDVPEYEDSWEIIFEENEKSIFGCNIVSLNPLGRVQEKDSSTNVEASYDSFIEEKLYSDYLDKEAELAYCLVDINKDGTDELIIRQTSLDEFSGNDFYTFSNVNGKIEYVGMIQGGYYPELFYSEKYQSVVPYLRTSTNTNFYYYKYNGREVFLDFSIMWERDDTSGVEMVYYYLIQGDTDMEVVYEHNYTSEEIGANNIWQGYVGDFTEINFNIL